MNVHFREAALDEGTIVLFKGTDTDAHNEVTVAIEHRPARDLVEALERGEHVEAEVEGWQVLSSVPMVYDVLNDEWVVARTKTGKVLTDEDFNRLADEAEKGHEL